MFGGYHNVSRSQRFKIFIVRKYKDSTILQQLLKKQRSLFKTILDLLRFTYVLRSSTTIQDLLRFHHPVFRFYLKRTRLKIDLDPPLISFSIYSFLPVPTLTVRILLEDNNPILPKFYFMCSCRYWYHIQDFEEILRRIFIVFLLLFICWGKMVLVFWNMYK